MLIQFLKPDFEFSDQRGQIIQLVHTGWKQVNYIVSVPGAARGSHYHKFNREAFFVIRGSFELYLHPASGGAKERHLLKNGAFFLLEPFVKHSFQFLEATELISMYSNGVELENGGMDMWE